MKVMVKDETTGAVSEIDLDTLLAKAQEKGRKEAMSKVGSQSVKRLIQDLPKISLKTKEELETMAHAAGHEFTTNFEFGYKQKTPGKRNSDKLVGGYSFAMSPEDPGYNKQVKLFIRVAGLEGSADLEDVNRAIAECEKQAEFCKNGAEIALDLAAGLKAIYAQMVKGEQTEQA